MDITLGTTSRRHILSASILTLVSVFLPGIMPRQDVKADKKKKKKIPSVAERTHNQREICETGGGQLAVLDGPNGGNTTECKGGIDDGHTCINAKKQTKCWQARTDPTAPLNDTTAPPSDGVNEQPSNNKPVGGGGAVDPIGGVEDPGGSDPGPIILLSERHAAVDAADGFAARRNGKRRKRGNGKSRKQ